MYKKIQLRTFIFTTETKGTGICPPPTETPSTTMMPEAMKELNKKPHVNQMTKILLGFREKGKSI